jgi:DNA-binding response OmpR family regulator
MENCCLEQHKSGSVVGDKEEDNPFTASKVLIVEDNSDACSLISGILWLKGIDSVKALSVDESIEKAAQLEKIDVVVMNGRLAQERGGFLVSRIRELKPRASLFVIVNNDSDRARVLQLGCDEFAKKPLSIESIAEKVMALLAKDAAKTAASL